MEQVSEIIRDLTRYIREDDYENIAIGLSMLSEREPYRWIRLLFDNGIISEPYIKTKNKDFDKTYNNLVAGIEPLCVTNSLPLRFCMV